MKTYDFTVIVTGLGDTPEEAWNDCREAVEMDGLGNYDEALPVFVTDDNEQS